MNRIFVAQIERLLNKGHIKPAIELLQGWLSTAEPGDLEMILETCSTHTLPKLRLLLRDVLSRYPNVLVGCPVLIYAQPVDPLGFTPSYSDDTLPNTGNGLLLPPPRAQLSKPCTDLHFLGWVAPDLLIGDLPQHLALSNTLEVPWGERSSAIAIFKSTPDFFEQETVNLPEAWWGELFEPVRGYVRITARMIVPYPDAQEAACIMQTAALGGQVPADTHFLTEAGRDWAMNEGLLFHESSKQLFRASPGATD